MTNDTLQALLFFGVIIVVVFSCATVAIVLLALFQTILDYFDSF